jgi:hypothetical protein
MSEIMKIKELLASADTKIFLRGENYYHNDYISSLFFDNEKNRYHGRVKGSYLSYYNVVVDIDNDEEVLDYECNCPYDYSDICKHLVAVFLAIENEDFELKNDDVGKNKTTSSKSLNNGKNELSLLNLIKNSSKKDLIEFLSYYIDKNNDFEKELHRFLIKPNVDEEIKFLIGDIKKIVDPATYVTFDNHPFYYQDGVNDYCDKLNDILQKSGRYLNKDRCLVGFYVSIEVIDAVNDLLDFNFEGFSLESLASDSFEVLSKSCNLISRYGTTPQKEEVFNILIKKSLEGYCLDDWNYNFINEVIKFVNEDNKNEIYEILDDHDSRKYYHSENQIIKSNIVESLEGKDKAYEFKMKHLEVEESAKIAFKDAINKKDFEFAEKLCLDNITKDKSHLSNFKWLKLLNKLYKSLGMIEKQIEISNHLLKNGKAEYYPILKKLYEKLGILDEKYDELNNMLIDNSNILLYGDVLRNEKEWGLLWREVQKNPMNILKFGEDLNKIYGDEICRFWRDFLIRYGESANSRGKYKDFVNKLGEFYKSGNNEFADEVFDYFRENHPRRTAMQDELDVLNSIRNRKN